MNNEEEIIIWLKKIHEELYALNSRLGEMSTEAKETYPPCSCFTCPQHGPLLKAIEQREQLRRE